MRDLIIDMADFGGVASAGDEVVLSAPAVRGSSVDPVRLITPQPRTLELVDGVVTVPVEVGPLRVTLKPHGGVLSGTTFKTVVPEGEGPITLRDCLEGQFRYDPPVVSRAEAAAESAVSAANRVGTAEQVGQWASDAEEAADRVGTAEQVGQWASDAQSAASTSVDIRDQLPATISSELDARVPPKVTEAIASDRAVADAAASAVSGAVAGLDLVESTDPRISQIEQSDIGLSWAVTDGDRAALAVTEAGDVVIPRLAEESRVQITESVTADLGERLPAVRDEPMLSWAVTDGDRAALAVTEAGDVAFARLSPESLSYLEVSLNIGTTPTTQQEGERLLADTSTGDLVAIDPATGQRATLAIAPQNVRDAGAALTWEAGGETWWQSTLDEGPWRAMDTSRLAIWGSSTTQRLGAPLSTGLATKGLTDFHRGGIPSEGSEHTLGRMGAVPFILDVTIQAVADTDISITLRGVTPSGVFTIPGKFGEVRGILRTDPGIGYYFKAELSATIPAGATFTPDAVEWRDAMQILNIGKNNLAGGKTAESVVAATVTAAEYSRTLGGLYLVMGHFLDTGWQTGWNAYSRTLAVNDELKARYGPRFIDLEAFTSSPNLWSLAGIEPTAEDIQAQADRKLPPSVSADPAHLSTLGHELVVDHLIIPALQSKGWI